MNIIRNLLEFWNPRAEIEDESQISDKEDYRCLQYRTLFRKYKKLPIKYLAKACVLSCNLNADCETKLKKEDLDEARHDLFRDDFSFSTNKEFVLHFRGKTHKFVLSTMANSPSKNIFNFLDTIESVSSSELCCFNAKGKMSDLDLKVTSEPDVFVRECNLDMPPDHQAPTFADAVAV